MRPPSPQASAPQLDLGAPPAALDASSDSALRAAFEGLAISRRMSFAEAMTYAHFAICIRTCAQIAVRRITKEQSP